MSNTTAPVVTAPSRERLIRTALRLFAERGFAAVSNREIVAACGLTKGTIYWYFESKEQLYEAAVSEAMGSFQRRLTARLTEGQRWDEQIKSLFSLFADVLDDSTDPHRDLLLLLVTRRGPRSTHSVSTADTALLGWLEAVLVGRGDDPTRTHELATLVHTTGLGIVAQAAAGRAVARPALAALLRLLGAADTRA